jgi:hypothetical protein
MTDPARREESGQFPIPERASEVRLRVFRPQTRADCEDGPRPCPHDRCRHHTGYAELKSCSLDVADEGEHTLDEVGAFLGLSRERVRQIERDAMRKLRARDIVASMHADGGFEATRDEELPSDRGEDQDDEPEDRWTEMAYRALTRNDERAPLDPDAVRAAWVTLGGTPTMRAIAKHLGFHGSTISVYRACLTAGLVGAKR